MNCLMLFVAIQSEVLDVKLAYRDTYMAALVCLITIEMTLDVQMTIRDAYRLALGKSNSRITFFPHLITFSIGVGNDHTTAYGEIVFLAEAEDDACSFGPFDIFGARFPSE